MKSAEAPVALVARLVPASPAVVYDEWLDPDALSDWMCPRPARPTNIEIDPTIGGRLRIDIEEDGVRFAVTGRYVELDRPRRLSFTWSCSTWPDPNLESLVTVTLEALWRRDAHDDSPCSAPARLNRPAPVRVDPHRRTARRRPGREEVTSRAGTS